MPATPTLILCDDLVAELVGAWAPSAPDAARREYTRQFGDRDAGEDRLTGRQVVLYPLTYASDAETRGEDRYLHRVGVQVAERYPDAGAPPVAWLDERVDFVYERIVQAFDFGRSAPEWRRRLRTEATVTSVYDMNLLLTGLFLSEIEFEFSELRDA